MTNLNEYTKREPIQEDGDLWYYSPSGYRQRVSTHKNKNTNRMWVNGKYIKTDHPLHKAGRYKSFTDAAFSSLENYKNSKEGSIYAITNPAWKGWVKIGMTVDAKDRCITYQTSSPYRDYVLESYTNVKDRRLAEKLIHRQAEKIAEKRHGEWFKMPLDNAIKLVKEISWRFV
tara:strand:- start:131 stop:649 length:519 start_codon:yes stop_codon:yes gene_type:complete